MPRKASRPVVALGDGSSRVKIYTILRGDGYPMFTLAWREGGRRRCRHLASMDEARLIAGQIVERLAAGAATGGEVTRRDLELLRHGQVLAAGFGVTLEAALAEWAEVRRMADQIPVAEALRFYAALRADRVIPCTVAALVDEFVDSRHRIGLSAAYVRSCRANLGRFAAAVRGGVGEVTTARINRFLAGLPRLAPSTRNMLRRNLVTMFRYARRQGYLRPDRMTAAELSDSFRVPPRTIEIFTPGEMYDLLLAANRRILPLIALGAFAGIRSAEICRLQWQDIHWDRGHIVISARIAKNGRRRIVPVSGNLGAWLAPCRGEAGPVITLSDYAGSLGDTAARAGIPGGWRQNALRHSFISYRVAETGDVARTSLEAGNSPRVVHEHYLQLVDSGEGREWFSLLPPEGWQPTGKARAVRMRRRGKRGTGTKGGQPGPVGRCV